MEKLSGREQTSFYSVTSSLKKHSAAGRDLIVVLVAVVLLVSGSGLFAQPAKVSHDQVMAFMAAGDIGGGVLTPGTMYPPTQQGQSTFVRTRDAVLYTIQTSGLPPGAYTVWWVVINRPDLCSSTPCTEEDIFFNPAVESSVFWSTGGIVRENGIANFHDRLRIGDNLGTPGDQHVFGPGLLYPMTAEVHNIIKYHGPASEDPGILQLQLTTLLGDCFEGANAVDLGPGFGIHCFDPQVVVHFP